MSMVAIAWVPDGLIVVSDTRVLRDDFELQKKVISNDFAMKIFPFEKQRMVVTLCGNRYIGNKKFEDIMIELSNDSLSFKIPKISITDFCEELLNIIMNYDITDSEYEIVVLGYDINNEQVIFAINIGKDMVWRIRHLNRYPILNHQNTLLDPFLKHLYGAYIAGTDILNVNDAYRDDEYEKRLDLHEEFRNMSIAEAELWCETLLLETMDYLNQKDSVPSVGGSLVKKTILNK